MFRREETMHDATMRETNARTIRRAVGPERWGSEAARQRFIASMQPVVGLHHPNLVRMDALGEHGDKVMIATEAVNGVTLESILAADPVLSIAAVPSILSQVAAALGYAHAAGIVHGALSSACVFIDLKGDALVSDLGVAWALASAGVPGVDDDSSALAYASPEVVRGEHPSASSDQYAFGVLEYELLAGRRPFEGSASKLRQAHLRRRPDPIETPYNEFPEEWSQAVMRMLEKEPADRFASLAGAARAIAPADGMLDQGFRGPLAWLVQEQLSGATAPPRVSVPVTRAANAPPRRTPADAPADAPASAPAGGRISAPVRAPLDAPIDPRAMASFMKEVLDTAPHRGPRLAARNVGTRGRAIMATVVVAVGAVFWYQLPSYTRARIWSTILFEKPLQWYSMPAESGSVVAPRAQTGTAPAPQTAVDRPAQTDIVPPTQTVVSPPAPTAAALPPKERLPVDRHPRVAATPPTHLRVTPPRSDDRPLNSAAKTPDRIVVAPVVIPPSAPASSAPASVADTPPVTAPTTARPTSAESSTTAHVLSAADAATAARAIVDQLRGTNVSALSLSMATSKMDRDFISWLSGRPVDLDIGAPPAPRVAETSDGGAQLSYVVPITWTHVSGARPTRAAILVVTVRPSTSGAPLTSWSLAQPFVP
jgi:hypothetical protein